MLIAGEHMAHDHAFQGAPELLHAFNAGTRQVEPVAEGLGILRHGNVIAYPFE